MNIRKSIFAFIFISALGTFLHFSYALSGNNALVGIFSAVNESVWEHQKLIYWPAVIYSIAEYLLIEKKPHNYKIAVCLGILFAILTVVCLFYTYSGILGFSVLFIDVLLYFLGVAVFVAVRNYVVRSRAFIGGTPQILAILILVVLGILFVVWTFFPPQISLFIQKTA